MITKCVAILTLNIVGIILIAEMINIKLGLK